jgi:CDP-glycerol glycerophosphotransferase (TagB/SpsB family)
MLRVCRKWMSRNSYGSISVGVIPPRSIFLALHYQPEQSTLAQGLWCANQTALVENISKSLPLGYTLVVKEHPWGRGNRPLWQYKHMSGFYNVIFCDAPSKQIIQQVDAVITVTGTVVMEALVFDKPAIMLGRNYFDFSDLIYRVPNIQELPEVLARILIDGDYQTKPNREERLHLFLMSYLDGLLESFPLTEYAVEWSHSLALELDMTPVVR